LLCNAAPARADFFSVATFFFVAVVVEENSAEQWEFEMRTGQSKK
jgi:hypothetical protein